MREVARVGSCSRVRGCHGDSAVEREGWSDLCGKEKRNKKPVKGKRVEGKGQRRRRKEKISHMCERIGHRPKTNVLRWLQIK